MAKARSRHVCQECGYESARWLGKCPSCGFWDTFAEERETGSVRAPVRVSKPRAMSEISVSEAPRIKTGWQSWIGSWAAASCGARPSW